MDMLTAATLAALLALGCIVALSFILTRAGARSEYDAMISDRLARYAGSGRDSL